jgi:DNA-binding transcriptional regulator YhcF (GntR family)
MTMSAIRRMPKSGFASPRLNCVWRSLLFDSLFRLAQARLTNVSSPRLPNSGSLAYVQIANGLRHEFISEKYAPGSKLPTIHQLAKIWKSSYFTIHTALTTLAKQGWVERIHGHGTYVADASKRFKCAGIYHAVNIWSRQEALFARQLNECLVERLHNMGKTTQVFIDSRPTNLHGKLPPDLVDAIKDRRIDCLISPITDSLSAPVLSRLSLPIALMESPRKRTAVRFDDRGLIQGSISDLVRQGCASVGLISNSHELQKLFLKEVKAVGLTTRKEWNLPFLRHATPLKEFGFHAIRRLYRSSKRPDGLIIYPDTVVEGAILAILQCGIRIPQEMKLVAHSNARVRLICPFPVTWAISDEDAVAAALIQSVERQFAGEQPQPATIPFIFRHDSGKAWLA